MRTGASWAYYIGLVIGLVGCYSAGFPLSFLMPDPRRVGCASYWHRRCHSCCCLPWLPR
jgi:hypothetical protein